jgi:hypothetical protein
VRAGPSLIVAVLFLGLVSSAPAQAARDRSGDVRGKGLAKSERRAMDITGVQLLGAGSALVITATMRGQVAGELGAGRLRNSVAGVALTLASGETTGVVARGTGIRPRDLIGAGLAGGDVVRVGRRLTFLIDGVAPGDVAAIVVGTATPGRATTARASQADHIEGWDEFITTLTGDPFYRDNDRWLSERPRFYAQSCTKQRELLERYRDARARSGRALKRLRGKPGDNRDAIRHHEAQVSDLGPAIELLKKFIAEHCQDDTVQPPATGAPTTPGGGTPTEPFSCKTSTAEPIGDRIGLEGSCSEHFDTIVYELLDSEIEGTYTVSRATSCKTVGPTRIECTTKPSADNPGHLWGASIQTRPPAADGHRVRVSFFREGRLLDSVVINDRKAGLTCSCGAAHAAGFRCPSWTW